MHAAGQSISGIGAMFTGSVIVLRLRCARSRCILTVQCTAPEGRRSLALFQSSCSVRLARCRCLVASVNTFAWRSVLFDCYRLCLYGASFHALVDGRNTSDACSCIAPLLRNLLPWRLMTARIGSMKIDGVS